MKRIFTLLITLALLLGLAGCSQEDANALREALEGIDSTGGLMNAMSETNDTGIEGDPAGYGIEFRGDLNTYDMVFEEASVFDSPVESEVSGSDASYVYRSASDDAEIAGAPSAIDMPHAPPLYDGHWDGWDSFGIDAPYPQTTVIQAGQITGGEWNDHDNWDFWLRLLGNTGGFNRLTHHWILNPINRIIVQVTDESGNPVRGADVVMDGFKAVTDHKGIAYLFTEITTVTDTQQQGASTTTFPISAVTISSGGITETIANPSVFNEVILPGASSPAKTLDLMFVIDTTGSMGDELAYLQAELEDVINRVVAAHGNLPIRLSVNFYRDHGDDYVVLPFPFSTDIQAQIDILKAQWADGGGDIPEAVDEALQNAIHEHDWHDDSIKLMFVVLDAPPHHNRALHDMPRLMKDAAEKGIRTIPVGASATCKETEFLMRSMAIITGGTYTFTTAHSGIGFGHVEPTIGAYEVELLNDILVRVINEYLS